MFLGPFAKASQYFQSPSAGVTMVTTTLLLLEAPAHGTGWLEFVLLGISASAETSKHWGTLENRPALRILIISSNIFVTALVTSFTEKRTMKPTEISRLSPSRFCLAQTHYTIDYVCLLPLFICALLCVLTVFHSGSSLILFPDFHGWTLSSLIVLFPWKNRSSS